MVRYAATHIWARLGAGLVICSLAVPVASAELQRRTLKAYEKYVADAKQAFLGRFEPRDQPRIDGGPRPIGISNPTALPSAKGQIVRVPGGLVHHWLGAAFVPGVTLDQALAVAQDYADYTSIHKSVIASRLLGRDGDTFHVFVRVKADAGMISTVLDLSSDVTYQRMHGCAFSFGESREIRQVKNAGRADERHVPSDDDGGYLWRANTFTRFVERDGGVYVELETLGLSRTFPKLLGWMLEPIAKKLGRASVERTLDEFEKAVLRTAA